MLPHAPYQPSLQQVPILIMQVDAELEDYQIVMQRKKLREGRIAPAMYRGRPVSPPNNPTSGASFHILRLVNPNTPGRCVDFLIRDANQYLVAYRRLVEGEWSPWYHFEDMKDYMPQFMTEAEYMSLNFKASHNRETTLPGGLDGVLDDMFFVLLKPDSNDEDLERVLFRAVLLFCEATRLSSVKNDIFRRWMDHALEVQELNVTLWSKIGKWSKMSKCSLNCRANQDVVNPSLLAGLVGCDLANFDAVIEELQLILYGSEYIQLANQPPLVYPEDFNDMFPLLDEAEEDLQEQAPAPAQAQGRGRGRGRGRGQGRGRARGGARGRGR